VDLDTSQLTGPNLDDNIDEFFSDFLELAQDSVEGHHKPEISVFREHSWYIPGPDGEIALDASYVRCREIREIDSDGNYDDFEISSTLKRRVADVDSFVAPSVKGTKETTECDVHSNYSVVSFKMKKEQLEETHAFGLAYHTFEDVVEVFTHADSTYGLDHAALLPMKDEFISRRYDWNDLKLSKSGELACSLDLRQRLSPGAGDVGHGPYYRVEFACDIKDLKESDGPEYLTKLQEIFSRLYDSDWSAGGHTFESSAHPGLLAQ